MKGILLSLLAPSTWKAQLWKAISLHFQLLRSCKCSHFLNTFMILNSGCGSCKDPLKTDNELFAFTFMWFGTCSNLYFKVYFEIRTLLHKKRILSSITCCQVLQQFSYASIQTSNRMSPLVPEVTFCSTRGQTEKVLAKVRALRPSLLSSCSPLKC